MASVQQQIKQEVRGSNPADVVTFFLQEKELEKVQEGTSIEILNEKIEKISAKKKDVDKKVLSTSESMKILNLQANSRAKLNLKKTEKIKRENELKKS